MGTTYGDLTGSSKLKYLPPVNWASPVAPRDTINESASSAKDTQLTVAAQNEPIPIIYGQPRIGPRVAYVLNYQSKLVILAVWGHGEIEGIQKLWLDDVETTASSSTTSGSAVEVTYANGIIGRHYKGTASQIRDSLLYDAFLAQSPSVGGYSDTLNGYAYSVFHVPAGISSGFPRLNVLIKGQKVYDPRSTTTAWSDNPALCLASFINNSTFGAGLAIDWSSVSTVADFNDELVGGEKRRTLNLYLDKIQTVSQWIDTLRTYASCWVVRSGDTIKLVADKPTASSYTFNHSLGNILSISDIKKRGTRDLPNVMIVNYTDTSVVPYKDAPAYVENTAALALQIARKESSISLPGINRYSQAYREAVERLNKLTLCDLSFSLEVFDEGLSLDIGDVVGVKHPIGISDQYGNAKLMRVLGISGEYGKYKLTLNEYDEAVYSNSVETAPTWADTGLFSPSEPPDPNTPTLSEVLYQKQNGTWASLLKASWTPVNYSFLSYYVVELWNKTDGTKVETKIINKNTSTYEYLNIIELNTYYIKLYVVSIADIYSSYVQSADLQIQGKFAPPQNVPQVTGFEAGGRVYLSWSEAPDIDTWKYHVKYWPVASSWESVLAKDVNITDSLTLDSDLIPVGTWVFGVKAIDSVGLYSANAATCTVTVTSDASSFFVDAKDFEYVDSTATKLVPATLTNMQAYSLGMGDSNLYIATEDNVPFATKFTNAMSTYTNPIASYHGTAMVSTAISEQYDFGLIVGGQFTVTTTAEDITGTHEQSVGFSNDDTAYIYPVGASHKVNTRFMRLKHTTTGGTLKLTLPTQRIRLDAVPRDETGSDISLTSGSKNIVLENKYVSVKSLTITPLGTTVRTGIADNIRVNGFQNSTDTVGVLQFDSELTATATGDEYIFWKMSNASRTILSGDYLEFDIMVIQAPVTPIVGLDIKYSDTTYQRSIATCYQALAVSDTWTSRSYALGAGAVGKSVSWFNVVNHAASTSNDVGSEGEYKILIKNVRITDGAGTTRQVIYNTGQSTLSTLDSASSARWVNYGMNQANSFDVYVLDASNTKIASDFMYSWKGI